jgi:hypothetical protein
MDEGAEKRLLQGGDACSLEPPPYQVPAYPRQSRQRRRLFVRSVLSIRTGLSFVVAASVLWLCFAVDRQYRTQSREDGKASPRLLQHFEESLAQCRGLDRVPGRPEPGSRTSNPRWTRTNGQTGTIVLKNATLFDGEAFIPYAVDIVFSKGIVEAVYKTADNRKVTSDDEVVEHDVQGRYVTPGLVDMHSHHFLMTWPAAQMRFILIPKHSPHLCVRLMRSKPTTRPPR